jgi:hypothetical protein
MFKQILTLASIFLVLFSPIIICAIMYSLFRNFIKKWLIALGLTLVTYVVIGIIVAFFDPDINKHINEKFSFDIIMWPLVIFTELFQSYLPIPGF